MTGLFRTSLVFFLPIFLGFYFYHSWQSKSGGSIEEQEAFLAHYESVIRSVEKLAESALKEENPNRNRASDGLEGTAVLLAEGVRGGTSVFRLLNPILADDPSWSMVPDPTVPPSFLTGFRFSNGEKSIPAFLVERTIYDAEGNPVALTIYIREENASHDVSP